MKLLCLAQLLHLAHAAQPALRRRSLIAAAPLTLLRPAHAAERYIEQKVAAELGADGQPVAYETVRRLTGEGTGLDLSRNEDISERIFVDAALTAYYKREIKPGSDVLDICSSWVSHYPQNLKLGRVAGTGMNERELRANTQLTEFTPVWKSKFYGAFVLNRRVDLHAIDATPALQPTHWLISTQVHATGPEQGPAAAVQGPEL